MPWLSVLGLFGALVAFAYADSDGPAEERRFYRAGDPNQLAWVSAEMATAENGMVDWGALPENTRVSYEELRKWQPTQIGENEDGTPIYSPWQSHGIPGFGAYWGPSFYDAAGLSSSDTTDQLIGNARYVVEGVVRSQEQGFFFDEPMTLLTLAISRIAPPKSEDNLSASHLTPMTEILYVAYPSARFNIGGHGFAKGDPAYPPLPKIGDKVLFFEFTLALDVERVIFRPAADKILVETAGRALNLKDYQRTWGKRLKREIPISLKALADKVTENRAFHAIGLPGGGV